MISTPPNRETSAGRQNPLTEVRHDRGFARRRGAASQAAVSALVPRPFFLRTDWCARSVKKRHAESAGHSLQATFSRNPNPPAFVPVVFRSRRPRLPNKSVAIDHCQRGDSPQLEVRARQGYFPE